MNFDLTITFGSIATILAGLIALLVYLLHRRDEKKKAAIIIISEIRQAEESISQLKKTGIVSDFTTVISENHWKEYQHFFATSLDQDEIKLISEFYTSCEAIEEQVKLIRNYLPLSMVEKIRVTQEKLVDLADRTKDKTKFEKEKKEVLDSLYWPNIDWFEPHAPKNKLISYVNTVNLVMSTQAGSKMKKIASTPCWKIIV